MRFTGRAADLALLDGRLRMVTEGRGSSRGTAVVVTGRRRVGKSRLVQEFCDRSGLPYVVFQATRGRSPVAERADFSEQFFASLIAAAGDDDARTFFGEGKRSGTTDAGESASNQNDGGIHDGYS